MKFIKNPMAVLAVLFVLVALGFTGPIVAQAAPVGIAPDLRTAAPYAIFGKAGVENTGAGLLTHIWGNVGADSGVTIIGLADDQVSGTIIAPTLAQIQTDTTAVYHDLFVQQPGEIISLHGTVTVTPGVYVVKATETLNGTVTLNGAGVYIFGSDSAFTVENGAKVLLTNGATACNVFWQIPSFMTIGTTAEMVGTIVADTGLISLATSATLQGRAWSSTKKVTLASNQITACTAVAAPAVVSRRSTINVVKTVINDNGRTKTVADFPLFVNGVSVVSGVTNGFPSNLTYFITETKDPNYTQSFSGDCDSNGQINLIPGDNRVCIITNNDIAPAVAAPVVPPVPPLIDVVKVPSPLALPAGPGPVTYTYTLRNIGTVPVTDITMVGDTCSPIILASGDTNNDAKLDVNETWVHTCSTTLSETHTNTVTATGWANGISATDIASATVVVGLPIVPPLIHLVKKPSVFTLPAPGGAVTYTYTVTNPGTEPLSNVSITDNKCTGLPGRVSGHPGDINKNDLLESNETWSFTCQSNLTQTTTNTGTASGEANGLIARDFAIATVVVAATVPVATVPKLPNTGIAPMESVLTWPIVAASIFAVLFLFYIVRKKQTI